MGIDRGIELDYNGSMEIEQVIKKAIEGGYKCCDRDIAGELKVFDVKFTHIVSDFHEHLLKPQFWQALGKAMGWGKGKPGMIMYEWLTNWHRFIDHLAEGKTIENYFEKL